jgi:hypothetical protein
MQWNGTGLYGTVRDCTLVKSLNKAVLRAYTGLSGMQRRDLIYRRLGILLHSWASGCTLDLMSGEFGHVTSLRSYEVGGHEFRGGEGGARSIMRDLQRLQ